MKLKTKCKIVIDILMTVALLVLMAQQLVGEKAHEWIGASMFVLFITHNILNFSWYRGLSKGKYSIYRIFQTALDVLVFLDMVGSMISGIILAAFRCTAVIKYIETLKLNDSQIETLFTCLAEGQQKSV